MILEETKMASVVLDEEEEAPSEPSATLLDGDGGDEDTSKEEETSSEPSATLLDGDGGDEDASKEEGAPAEDGTM